MIPKIIHYCWFGQNDFGEFKKNVVGWKKLNPDYELILWDESNLPLRFSYVRNSFNSKNYSNLSNFIRLWAVYNFGGIYLDVDVKLIRSLDVVLNNECFFSKEKNSKGVIQVNNAVMGAKMKHWFIRLLLEGIMHEFDGLEYSNLSGPILTTKKLLKFKAIKDENRQIILDIVVFGVNVFHPVQWDGHIKYKEFPETIGVHEYAGSWKSKKLNYYELAKSIFFRRCPETILNFILFGPRNAKVIKNKIVVDGPFSGLILHNRGLGSAYFPKLFGTCEECLHQTIYGLALNEYDNLIVFGVGEGYYGLGLYKLLKPKNNTILYDILEENIIACNVNAEINNIKEISILKEKVNADTLLTFNELEKSLIFCDIEGDEVNVFTDQNIYLFKNADLIIEIHDHVDIEIYDFLVKLFYQTHNIETIYEDRYNFVRNRQFSRSRAFWYNELYNENRPIFMRWLVLKSKLF